MNFFLIIKTQKDIDESKKRLKRHSFIDEPRVSKGSARWTEGFTEPKENKFGKIIYKYLVQKPLDYLKIVGNYIIDFFREDEKPQK